MYSNAPAYALAVGPSAALHIRPEATQLAGSRGHRSSSGSDDDDTHESYPHAVPEGEVDESHPQTLRQADTDASCPQTAKSSTCNQMQNSEDNEKEREAEKGRGGVVWDRGDGEFILPNEPVAQDEEEEDDDEEEGAGAREEEAVWQGVKAAGVLRERELQGDAQRQSGEHPRHPQRQMMCEQELDRGSMKQEVLERARQGGRGGSEEARERGRKRAMERERERITWIERKYWMII